MSLSHTVRRGIEIWRSPTNTQTHVVLRCVASVAGGPQHKGFLAVRALQQRHPTRFSVQLIRLELEKHVLVEHKVS